MVELQMGQVFSPEQQMGRALSQVPPELWSSWRVTCGNTSCRWSQFHAEQDVWFLCVCAFFLFVQLICFCSLKSGRPWSWVHASSSEIQWCQPGHVQGAYYHPVSPLSTSASPPSSHQESDWRSISIAAVPSTNHEIQNSGCKGMKIVGKIDGLGSMQSKHYSGEIKKLPIFINFR